MKRVRTLRTKILIGLLPTLAILVALGLWAIGMFYQLGGNIDVILRENYRSVIAAEGMKEAIERMDSGLLFATLGREELGRKQFEQNRKRFEEQLRIELGNVTVPGEREVADDLSSLFQAYVAAADRFFRLPAEPEERRTEVYFGELVRTFDRIRTRADEVLTLNQDNMTAMDLKAREYATWSTRMMIGALLGAIALTLAVALRLSRSIAQPIQAVTVAARALSRGQLDQVVATAAKDELGELSTAFNQMARTIREYRQAGTARLIRAQKTAQATIDSFPDPVVVVDPLGAVELANPAACRLLGVVPAAEPPVPWFPPAPLRSLLNDVLAGRGNYLPLTLEQAIFLPDGPQERYFLPRVVAIRAGGNELIGAAVNLVDVTKFHLLDRLKSDMVSTVSHELKTPLTSVQMAVHLLLEEVVGPLNAKQIELLLAARQDADRILAMINDLLDLTRIEQGRVRLDLEPLSVGGLLGEAVARMQPQADDAGLALESDVPPPDVFVMVDRDRIGHVFDNLIGNAIQHTPRGGLVRLSARLGGEGVQVEVRDTGKGISGEHLPHIFEKFYRIPGESPAGGAGLGLAIVREIITAHGGRIDVASRPGKGTSFTFSLPLCTAAQEPAEHNKGSLPCPTVNVS
jgi:signal transduction histidine kinase/HAMP domain-containing protein